MIPEKGNTTRPTYCLEAISRPLYREGQRARRFTKIRKQKSEFRGQATQKEGRVLEKEMHRKRQKPAVGPLFLVEYQPTMCEKKLLKAGERATRKE